MSKRGIMVPTDQVPRVMNRAAALGVSNQAFIRACIIKQSDAMTEDMAAACESTELAEAWERQRAADRARRILSDS